MSAIKFKLKFLQKYRRKRFQIYDVRVSTCINLTYEINTHDVKNRAGQKMENDN